MPNQFSINISNPFLNSTQLSDELKSNNTSSVLSAYTQPIQPQSQYSEEDSRDFLDTTKIRKNIYDRVLEATQNIGKLQNSRHTLELTDLNYIDDENIPLSKQKLAILSGKSLYRRLRGKWRLLDNATGNILDEKIATVAQVPYMTERGTFILNGTEYNLSSQWRLRPGIFTRIKENGELESHVNVMPGNGISHRYFLDPETGIFKINIGQAKLPLLPVLKALGVKESELRKEWGDEIFNANVQAPDGKTINKLYQRIVRKKNLDATDEDKKTAVANTLLGMKLDPEVTKRTLGKPHESLTKETIIDATKKLIAVSKLEADPDDRDHLAYQNFYGPEDLLSERITKDKGFLRQLLWKASFKGNLSSIQPNVLSKQLQHTILHTGLGQASEEINSAELLDARTRATRLGEGGLASLDAVPDESRNVIPSQLGFIDIVKTPESGKVGIDTRVASTVRKGKNGKLYAPFIDVKTGQKVYKSPQDIAESVIAFPGELRKGEPFVAVIEKGMTKFVPREKVDYEMPHMENAFSPLSNMVPLKSALKGQRMSMGARFISQALPLINREAPLVQAGMPNQNMIRSFEEEYGKQMGAVIAEQDGTVRKVTNDSITIAHDDGTTKTYDLYNNFPYARKTFIHNEPLVKVGDRINSNQILAKSNFTDDSGTTALGINLRVAFIPMYGPYEDSIIISQSTADKLTSIHMYQEEQEWSDNIKKGLKSFISLFPTAYTKQQLDSMDENGVVKPGTVLNYGDPMILVAQETERTHSQIHKGRKPTFSNKTITWDHYSPGIVTDTVPTAKGVAVAVKSENKTQIGDKLSNKYGAKGIIAKIIPDEQMPHDESGKPYELIFNPLGIISRINPAQIAETVLGKIAKLTNKKYKIEDFSSIDDLMDFVEQEMKKYNIKDLDTIVDPVSNKKIPNILTGYQHILKLHHTSESKGQGRGIGGYDANEVPSRSSEDSSKRLALLESSSLLSHGATEFLRDAHVIRGQKNDQYWQAFMSGFRPPDVRVPLIYHKFIDSLKGAGINAVRNGRQIHLMALTDKDIIQLASDRNITNADTVDWKGGLKPKPGGLFDPSLSGGHGGQRWSALKLFEPMPNPAFEEPIRRILGLTQQQLEDVIAGKNTISNFGTGPKALKDALENINLDKAIEIAEAEIKGSKKTARDEAIRKLGFLKNAKRLNIHPKDWILSRVPILPPIYRPVSVMAQTGNQLVSDINYLYKELFEANDVLQEVSKAGIGDLSNERLNVYNAFKAVTGLGDPITAKNKERQVKGLLQQIFGSSPKFGCYSDDTEILTSEGWINFNDLTLDMEVATLNPNTFIFTWQKPTEIQHYDYNGELIHIKTKNTLDLLVTPSHRHFIRVVDDNQSDITSGWEFINSYEWPQLGELYLPSAVVELKQNIFTVFVTLILINNKTELEKNIVAYKGKVHCCTVSNQIILVKRNNKIVFSGNSIQSKLLGASVELVGRAVISPNADLDMDQVGLPENKAWDVYKPFIIRRLVQRGVPRLEALRSFNEKLPIARKALLDELEYRPVVISRAPVLHRFGIQGAWPVLVKGDVLQLPPIMTKGFGADFDGNCITYNSEICIKLNWQIYHNTWNENNLDILKKFAMRLLNYQTPFVFEGTTILKLPIGEFPRFGEPVIDKNGADVYSVPDGITILTYDHKTATVKFSPVTNFTVEKNCKCVRVTTQLGKQIEVSNNESLAVYDKFSNSIVKVKPIDAVGRVVPFIKKYPCIIGTNFDRDLGWWYGSLVSDGWISGNTVGYTKLDNTKREEFIRIACDKFENNFTTREYFEEHSAQKFSKSVKLCLTGAELVNSIFNIYSNNSTTVRGVYQKKLPQELLQHGSEECLWGLLSGLLDGNCFIGWFKSKFKSKFFVRYKTYNSVLVNDLKYLFSLLGIRTNVITVPASKSKQENYILLPSLRDLYDAGKKLTLVDTHNKKFFEEFLTNARPRDDFDIVPLPDSVVQPLLQFCLSHNKSLYTTIRASSSRGYITRDCANIAISYTDDAFVKTFKNWIDVVGNTDVFWDLYEKIEQIGEHEVFDLSVPDTKIFAANDGLIVYDTMNYHVPASEEARQEVIDKLIPSRNLIAPATMKVHFLPQQEYQAGLYIASTAKNSEKHPAIFRNAQDAIKAYNEHRISYDTPVEIIEG